MPRPTYIVWTCHDRFGHSVVTTLSSRIASLDRATNAVKVWNLAYVVRLSIELRMHRTKTQVAPRRIHGRPQQTATEHEELIAICV